MAPVTGPLCAQTLAEALAGMTFVQLVRPGAPVVLGSFASSMSMQSGAPTFGTPEPALVLYVMAALARRLGVPFRSGGSLCASKVADAQAAYESAATLQPTVLGGVNFVLHAAGWLEGGLSVGYEKFILDADQCGMMAVFVKGVDLSENGQGLDAIRENGPAALPRNAHTLANFESAFYRSETADNNSFEQWVEDGSLDAAQRANKIWKRMLAEYEAPPIDPGIDEALTSSSPRKASFPDSRPRCSSGAVQSFRPGREALARVLTADVRAGAAEERDGPRGAPSAGATVSVTASPAKGLEATVALSEQLQGAGSGRAAPLGADGARPPAPVRSRGMARSRGRATRVHRRRGREGAR